MGIAQGLAGISLLLGGAGVFISAVLGLANSTMNSDLGYGLATSGLISIILGYIMIRMNE